MRARLAFLASVIIAFAASPVFAAADETKDGAHARNAPGDAAGKDDKKDAAPAADKAPAAPPGGAPPSAPVAVASPPIARKVFPRLKAPSLVHRNQLGLAVLPGAGYRVIAPYQENIPCGQQDKRVCTGMLPFFIDAQPSFGFGAHWDVLLDLRFGIVSDFTHSHQFAVAPGIRYWVDPELEVKFFATLQGVYDATPQNNGAVHDSDFGVRNANGLMFEVMRNFGIYAQLGETVAFRRWLRFEIDGGVGVQVRIP
jgi:hypothetical protein